MTDNIIKKQAREINMLYKVNEEQETEINRLKMVIDIKDDACIDLVEEIKQLQQDITDLQSELTGATNDYKQATNEIKLLNNQIDNLIAENNYLSDIVDELKKENNALKFRNKMLIRTCLNSVYGMCVCKKHFDYEDTDSIKETKNNDDNN